MSGRVPDKSSAYPDERNWEGIPIHLQTIQIMKTSFICIMLSVFLFSCSAEADVEIAVYQSGAAESDIVQICQSTNPLNPFDHEGEIILEALHLYYQKHGFPNSVPELCEQIRQIAAKSHRTASVTQRLIPFTDEMVQAILEDPDSSMILTVQNSVLQQYAKDNLISFLQNLMNKRQQEFSMICAYILEYENQVLADTAFTAQETETILTVASISRYSLYSEEERKDKDWDILHGNKAAKPFFGRNEVPIVFITAFLDKVL
ncbi:hypothetical protein AAFH68_24450 [Flavobacterium sp. CGRL1]